jgi:HAMP domain-containing protein
MARARAWLLALALLWVGAMGALYAWARRGSAAAELEPAATADKPGGAAPEKPQPARKPARTPKSEFPRHPVPLAERSLPRELEPEAPRDEGATPPEAPLWVEIRGRIVDDAGEPQGGATARIVVGGRERSYRAGADGTWKAKLPAGEVDAWAERFDGALRTRSPHVTFDGSEGGEWDVDLVLPSERKAGLGIGIAEHPDGIAVSNVEAGSPAEDLGLVPGDVIVAAGGEPVGGLSLEEFQERMTGPEGSTQSFIVRHEDGREERLQFTRRTISGERR